MVTPRTQPVELHAHAMDNLKYIRQTMERAGSFTAVPGKGGVLMGAVAVLAAGLAHRQAGASAWLAVWTAAALIAMAIGILGAALKSRRFRIPLFSGPGRKFVAGFAPALLAGAVMMAVFYPPGISGFLPGGWPLKSRRFRIPLFSGPGRKFVAGFAPALLAGAVLPPGFYRSEERRVGKE